MLRHILMKDTLNQLSTVGINSQLDDPSQDSVCYDEAFYGGGGRWGNFSVSPVYHSGRGMLAMDANLTLTSQQWPGFPYRFSDLDVISAPCAFIWIASLLRAFYLLRIRDDDVGERAVCRKKMLFSSLLAMVTLLDLGLRVLKDGMEPALSQPTGALLAPTLLLVTVLLNTALVRLERQKGVMTSPVHFWFWFILTVTQAVRFYTVIVAQEYLTCHADFCVFFLKFALIATQVLLHCLSEKPTVQSPQPKKSRDLEAEASVISKLTFMWMGKILALGYKGKLTEDNLSELAETEKSANVMPRLVATWDREVAKARLKNQQYEYQNTNHLNGTRKKTPSDETDIHRENDSLLTANEQAMKEECKAEENGKKCKAKPKHMPSFLLAVVKTFGWEFLFVQLWKLARTVLGMLDPLVFGILLDFVEDKEAPSWRGYAICLVMFASNCLQMILDHRSHFFNHKLAIRIVDSIRTAVFRKALTMDTESRQESTVGQAVNLMSQDADQICHTFTWMSSAMWAVPVRIGVSLVLLYNLLGPAMLNGVAVLVVMIVFNMYVTRRLNDLHKQSMEQKDKRLKNLTEVINGIKVLKMYAWEPSFFDKVNDVRNKELDVMWRRAFWETAMHCYWHVTPYLVSVVVFMSYIYNSDNHYLAPSVAFVALSLINILREAMGCMPHIISCFVKSSVSFKRVTEFLFRSDLDDDISHDSDPDEALSIKNGTFTWTSGAEPTLKNINVNVKKGSLVAVVGTVGSGKSSLVSACLGEMKRLQGQVKVKGSVAYVAQQAWIQHATLRDNVLFGTDMEQDRYDKCLDACCLRSDLDILPGGDQTEIGEKGINLSGGQKQRVSLARAVYSNADLYLLDDPLSAVDCHVGSHIFNQVIGHQGLLAGKTRVLVTHGVQWLPLVDQVIVMKHGRVSEVGTYDELLSHNGPFAKFLKHHFAHHQENEEDPEVRKLKSRILSRLDSIPKDASNDSSSESNSDNEAVVQELLRTVSQEHGDSDTAETSAASKDKPGTAEPVKKDTDKAADTKNTSKLVEDEDFKVQDVNIPNALKEMAKNFGYRWVFLGCLLYAAEQCAERTGSIYLSQWTDDQQLANLTSLPPNSDERLALNNHYLILYAGFGVINAVMTLSFKLIQLVRRVVVARMLHSRMLDRVLRAPMSFFDTTPVGRIVNRFSSHLNTVDHELPETLVWMLGCGMGLATKVALVCYTTPAFLLLLVPLVIFLFCIQRYIVPTMRKMDSLASKTMSPIYSFFSETLGGTTTVRAYGAQDRFLREFQCKVDLHETVHFNWGNAGKWLSMRTEGVGSLILLVVTASAVTLRHSLPSGLVGLAVSVAMDVTETLNNTVLGVNWLQTETPSVDRVKEYSEMEVEADWRKEETKPSPSWPQAGEVKVDDLAVRYREGMDLVLKSINVSIAPGEKVGIVGRTGAGKSSLTLALFRLIEPARGHVTIDDVNTRELGLHDLRSRLTILPQDPVIFAGSVRMNLDPFSRYTDQQLWEAVRHAHLTGFVDGLQDGLGHDCGEGGENLSVGQRQLLCLARTLLHKTHVLVLDEATAAVDMETDELIQRTIRSEFSECTVLTIAHRLNTVIDYDKILVLDKGEVNEFDTPVRLMQDPSSVFHGMAKSAGLLSKLPELIAKKISSDTNTVHS